MRPKFYFILLCREKGRRGEGRTRGFVLQVVWVSRCGVSGGNETRRGLRGRERGWSAGLMGKRNDLRKGDDDSPPTTRGSRPRSWALPAVRIVRGKQALFLFPVYYAQYLVFCIFSSLAPTLSSMPVTSTRMTDRARSFQVKGFRSREERRFGTLVRKGDLTAAPRR